MNSKFSPCYDTRFGHDYLLCGLKTIICTLELKLPYYSPALRLFVSNLDPDSATGISHLTGSECF